MKKNQSLAEALEVLEIKRGKAYRSVRSDYCSTSRSASRSFWSAHNSTSCSVWSAYWAACDSVKLDKPKVLEIIKGKLK